MTPSTTRTKATTRLRAKTLRRGGTEDEVAGALTPVTPKTRALLHNSASPGLGGGTAVVPTLGGPTANGRAPEPSIGSSRFGTSGRNLSPVSLWRLRRRIA